MRHAEDKTTNSRRRTKRIVKLNQEGLVGIQTQVRVLMGQKMRAIDITIITITE